MASAEENLDRILAVQSCFGPKGMSLKKPGRVLVGEGRLVKLCRRRPKPRAFFLFNDILVYGSILINGRLYAKQKVIQVKNIEVENLEDSPDMKNQFLIRTPCKSFYVSAPSHQEKSSWISHIKECRGKLEGTVQEPGEDFASSWIPDSASDICMRCCDIFTATNRRHHCRKCGFLVCGSCSNKRFLIPNISSTPKRVCLACFTHLQASESTRNRGDSEGNSVSDELSSDDDGTELKMYLSSQHWEGEQIHVVQGWSPYSAN